MKTDPASRSIELMVRNVNSLFNSMDPSPFRDRDLNTDAEDFIVSSAREIPADTPLLLRIHLQEAPAGDATEMARQAIHNYFDYRARLTLLEFRRLMREGRLSLVIGLSFLFACLLAQSYLLPQEQGPLLSLLRESLTIAGWVAMSQPLQTYLYNWWPIRRRRRVFSKLSRIPVELVLSQPGGRTPLQ